MMYNVVNDILINCHTHGEYSNLRLKDSTNKIKDVILYVANKLGQSGFALTDHEMLGGHLKFMSTVNELKRNGEIPETFTPILGNEIYLLDEDDMNQRLQNKERIDFTHFILIALDDEGHAQLRELSTRAWSRMFNYKGLDRVPTYYTDLEEIIGQNQGHLVGSTACLGGRLGKSILREQYDEAEQFIEWGNKVFGEGNFYLEMQPHKSLRTVGYDGIEKDHEQYTVNSWIQERGHQTIITTDAHYLTEEGRRLHETFLKSDEDEEMFSSGGREVGDFYETTYFMSTQEIKKWLYYLDENFINECLLNTWKIKERVKGYNLFRNQVIPQIPLPAKSEWYWDDDIADIIYDNSLDSILDLIESENPYDNYLVSLCMYGIRERNIPKEEWLETLERLNDEAYELIGISGAKEAVISAYFITMHKFIEIIWEEAQAFVGVSRGSGAGFMTNYLLQIVQINPLKQPTEMPLWRFISSARPELPDIDIDISSHKRDLAFQKVHDYMVSNGGDVVRVGIFKTESSKSAMQTACRGLGIPSDIGLFLSSLIPVVRGNTRSLHDTYYGNEDEGLEPVTEFVNQVDKYEGLLETALGIEGLISGRSSHACFAGDERVETEHGLKAIKDIKVGDMVLTHTNTYKRVVKTMSHKTDNTYKIKATGLFETTTTGDHPYYIRKRGKNGKSSASEPQWLKVKDIQKGDYVGQAINTESFIPQGTLPFHKDCFWWIVGRFVGDGWLESPQRKGEYRDSDKRIVICCNKRTTNELETITTALDEVGFNYRIENARTTYKVILKYIGNEALYNYLEGFGKYASGKRLNGDVVRLPNDLLQAFLDGYISADGHYYEDTNYYSLKTVSKDLALGVQHIVAKLYHRSSTIAVIQPKQEIIEGRQVKSKEKYDVRYKVVNHPYDKCFYENGYIWCPVKEVVKLNEFMEVYNITVVEDSSYTVNRAVVHNCGVIPSFDLIGSCATMKAPSGETITQYDLGDCEQAGLIKYDLEKSQ